MVQLAANAIVITGIGMQSSLGNAVTACAAARAGITLARELEDFVVLADDGTETNVVGHPIEAAAGFRGLGKLLNLAGSALHDLLAATDLVSLSGDKTALFLSAPDHAPEDDGPPRWTAQTLCDKLVARSPLKLDEGASLGIADDGVGFGAALARAVGELREGRRHRCIVGAVDSLLEPEIVEWLSRTDRLKTSERPDGLRPSEGAAFVLIERHESAVARGVEPMAHLRDYEVVGSDEESPPGVELATAITRLLARTGQTTGTWLLSDHNGESSSAADLGHARVRLNDQHPDIAAASVWFPAASFGDTAGALGPIALCAAATAFARGYAPEPTALVVFASNDDSRVAIRLDGAGR